MSKLICHYVKGLIRPSRFTSYRTITTTKVLYAEPPRKKRRIDPAVLRVRVERKLKKTEKEINRLENEPKQLIPIQEYQLTNSELRELQSRPGRTPEDVGITYSSFKAAQRLWNFYRLEQFRKEKSSIRRVERSQTHALDILKKIDEGLYKRTVAVDEFSLIPYSSSHIKKETAPNPNYKPPDGLVKDVTKEWIM